jgi:glyoxylase-like metal-dependent hydrolase (beta-lactamase superfamily II)
MSGVDALEQQRRLEHWDVLCVRAENPGPLTLSGTNSWVVGRDPAYLIDPGPALEEHINRLLEATRARGGLAGIALTHDHADHSEALPILLEHTGAVLAAGRGEPDVELHDGARFGPFQALYTPGHASDHYSLIAGPVCFTGDAVLGEGSVFVAPEPGALAGYLAALEQLGEYPLEVLCPGHGPAIWEPQAKLEQYIAHRLERERGLIDALDDGARSVGELLDRAWSDVPEQMRPAAAVTLAAHLDKLSDEGRLREDVERPTW